MFTLKTLKVTTNPNTMIPGERLLLWVTATFTDSKKDETIEFKAENKEVMDDTLRLLIARLNERDATIASINVTNYVIPEVQVEVPPELTPEQLKQIEINQKEQELKEEVERSKRDKEIALIAETDLGVATKLAELEALKS